MAMPSPSTSKTFDVGAFLESAETEGVRIEMQRAGDGWIIGAVPVDVESVPLELAGEIARHLEAIVAFFMDRLPREPTRRTLYEMRHLTLGAPLRLGLHPDSIEQSTPTTSSLKRSFNHGK